ncbi:hypothetical protein HBB16_06580 [Pseudonocardia sp. MCCB 268]|nr:hypothetical protein [Pseudonocardia cytotoxica]
MINLESFTSPASRVRLEPDHLGASSSAASSTLIMLSNVFDHIPRRAALPGRARCDLDGLRWRLHLDGQVDGCGSGTGGMASGRVPLQPGRPRRLGDRHVHRVRAAGLRRPDVSGPAPGPATLAFGVSAAVRSPAPSSTASADAPCCTARTTPATRSRTCGRHAWCPRLRPLVRGGRDGPGSSPAMRSLCRYAQAERAAFAAAARRRNQLTVVRL